MKRRKRTTLRSRVEAAIERLISMLDELDGDPDLEGNGDDEPSFGGAYFCGGRYEIELEDDSAEAEPFLGWSEAQSLIGAEATGRSDEGTEGGLGTRFEGRGAQAANAMLTARGLPRVRLPVGYGE